jgi:PAS domain S-box-containing protein
MSASDEPMVAPAEEGSRSLADMAPVMIWVTGAGGSGVMFNAGWLRFTGGVLDDQLGDGWLASVHPDDRPGVVSAYGAGGVDGDSFELECRLRRADGVYRWLFCRAVMSTGPGGADGYVSSGFDVTERRQLDVERSDLLAGSGEDNARLAALQQLTARLAALNEPGEVAGVVLGQGVAELGATTASLCLLSGDGDYLEVAAHAGYSEAVTAHWGRFRLEAATPAGEAVRHGAGIYVSTLAELHERYPIFGGAPIVGDEALAVLPLVADDTGPLGAMVFGFAHPRTFPDADRQMLEALASQAATALARTRSRAALEQARAQLGYLADASAALASSLDLDDTLATVAALAVPRLADRCGVFLATNGRIEARLWVPAEPGIDPAVFDRYPINIADAGGVGAVIRTGRTVFAPQIDEAMVAAAAKSDDHHQLLRQVGFGAGIIVALRARGQSIGALALTNRSGHPMAEADRALAEELAARAAVAIDNAALFETQASVARRLQASLLPPALPTIAGLDLAARYAPAGRGVEVGGDFYDCIATGDDRWLLIVGDVKGKGVDAAALTGMARHTIRAAATAERGPAAVLAFFNEVLYRHEAERIATDASWEATEPRFCTVVAVELIRTKKSLAATVASAAHPLPLLRRPDGAVTAVGEPGGLLGLEPVIELPEVAVELAPGSMLVCFTDGVSECHNGPRFFDECGMADVLAAAVGPAERVVADIETAARTFTPTGVIRDDLAILALRVPD